MWHRVSSLNYWDLMTGASDAVVGWPYGYGRSENEIYVRMEVAIPPDCRRMPSLGPFVCRL